MSDDSSRRGVPSGAPGLDPATRRRVRRTAIVFGCIAAALYLGYIGMAIFKAETGGQHSAARPAAAAPR